MGIVRTVNRWIGGPDSVRAKYSSKEIRAQLSGKKLRPRLFFAVHSLKGLSVERYDGVLLLVDNLIDRAEKDGIKVNNWKFKMGSADELQNVDFLRLLNNKRVMNSVFNGCVFVNESVINLQYLPGIFDDFVKSPR